jgi:hypothetical protein
MVAIASVADAHPVTLETDDIPDLQLTPAPTIDVSVDGHQAIGDDLFDVSAGVEKPRELEELAEADIVPADGNVFDRSRIRHHCPMISAVAPLGPRGRHANPPELTAMCW